MDSQPDDIETLKAELAVARAKAADDAAMIAQQKLEIAKLRRQIYGPRSERTARLLDQMELELAELEAAATEDEIAAERAAAKTTTVAAFTRKRPARQPFPAHLPRERVVVPGPTACACCGGTRLRKLGETITETLEVIPRQWKVIQHVREKMTCRDCEKISEPPAPFHVTPRGWAGPHLLAMLLFEKFGQHQPLNRQAERYAREGVPLSLSTLADQVGAGCAVLEPLLRRIERHVLGAERLHGDDTTVPVLAKGKTDIGRCWAYVRDDRPFAGRAPPAAMFYYSRDRGGEHPRGASRRLVGPTPGRRLRRLQSALCCRAPARANPGSGLLGPCAPAVLRARRYRSQCPSQGRRQGAGTDLALGAGGRPSHRCPVRDRAGDQWPERRGASRGAPGSECSARRRSRSLDAGGEA